MFWVHFSLFNIFFEDLREWLKGGSTNYKDEEQSDLDDYNPTSGNTIGKSKINR